MLIIRIVLFSRYATASPKGEALTPQKIAVYNQLTSFPQAGRVSAQLTREGKRVDTKNSVFSNYGCELLKQSSSV